MSKSAATWPLVPLADVGRWFGGGTPTKNRTEFWANGSVPWLSPKDMGADVITSTQDRITPAAIEGSSARLVPANSVAIVVRSGILERKVPIGLVPFEVTLNQDMKAVVPRDGIDPRWVAWGLRAMERDVLRECRKAGTTVASIETVRLMARRLPVPPIDEQRRIVEILEEHLSRLDAADAYLDVSRRRVRALQASAHAELWRSAAGSGELVPVAKLGEVITGTTPPTRSGAVFGGTLPFATPSDLAEGREVVAVSRSLSPLGADLARVVSGAVLAVCIGATLGKVGWTRQTIAFNQQINAVVTDRSAVCPAFLAAAMASPAFQRQMWAAASSTTLPVLNKSRFSRLVVPVPAYTKQEHFLAGLDTAMSASDRLAAAVAAETRRARTLRQALLHAAFTGRLTCFASDADRVEELAASSSALGSLG